MELSYDNMLKFMEEYFTVYSKYGQKTDSAQRMHEFFTPDLRFIPYIEALGGPEGGFHSRDEFLRTAVAHTAWYEILTPQDITIDDRRKTVAVVFGMEVVDNEKDKVVVKRTGIAHYQLALDDNNTIKIKTIRFFWQTLPPDTPEFYDLYGFDDVE